MLRRRARHSAAPAPKVTIARSVLEALPPASACSSSRTTTTAAATPDRGARAHQLRPPDALEMDLSARTRRAPRATRSSVHLRLRVTTGRRGRWRTLRRCSPHIRSGARRPAQTVPGSVGRIKNRLGAASRSRMSMKMEARGAAEWTSGEGEACRCGRAQFVCNDACVSCKFVAAVRARGNGFENRAGFHNAAGKK